MVRCFLTTFDNPYSPYDEFEKWYQYDVEHGYNSSGLLMRIAETSSQFTDNENAYEIEKAIDKIVAADPINNTSSLPDRPRRPCIWSFCRRTF